MQRSDYDLLAIDEVARTIGHSARHVRRMIADGEFPEGFPAPKQLRWQWSDVRDWVVRQKVMSKLPRPGGGKEGPAPAAGAQKSDIPGRHGTSRKDG